MLLPLLLGVICWLGRRHCVRRGLRLGLCWWGLDRRAQGEANRLGGAHWLLQSPQQVTFPLLGGVVRPVTTW